jgi:hypothetical protein
MKGGRAMKTLKAKTMRMMNRSVPMLAAAAALCLTACASFKLKDPPEGFAVVSSYEGDGGYLRAKARDNVGLNIVTYPNVEGGTLVYWSGDLVEKLGRRGYELVSQKAVRAKNGVQGTRFDFRYTPPGEASEKFYTVVLYASDEHIVVAQLGGSWEYRSEHEPHAEAIAKDLKIRGCKAGSKVCKGPQPSPLQTKKPEDPAKPSPGGTEPPIDPLPVDEPPAEKPADAPATAAVDG